MALAQTAHRSLAGRARASLLLPLVVSLALALLAVGFVAFVLWPRWPGPDALGAPPLPITLAGELFNVPPAAIRLATQRHAGPQERLALAFLWPSLNPPDPDAKPTLNEEPKALDRLFVTVAPADATVPPAERVNTRSEEHTSELQLHSFK